MKRAAGLFVVLASAIPKVGAASDGGPSLGGTTTSTLTDQPSLEDLELARYLSVLENLEVLEDLEMLELMPILEEDGDGR